MPGLRTLISFFQDSKSEQELADKSLKYLHGMGSLAERSSRLVE
jgi:hypothetical protein